MRPSLSSLRTAFGEALLLAVLVLGLSVSYYSNYSFGGVPLNFLVTSLAVQWAMVFQYLLSGDAGRLQVDLTR